MQARAQPGTPPSRAFGEPLLALQVLRFVAAGAVLIHHAGFDADTIAVRIGEAPFDLDRWFDGSFGIHLFFVLSGFIMVFAERDFGREGAARRFLVRRVIRVVPLYWALTTLVLVGALVAPALLNAPVGGWLPVLGSYLFIPIPRGPTEPHPVLGQGWTLNYEMLFYAAFALAMIVPRRIGLPALAAGFVALVVAGRIAQPQSLALRTWTDPLLFEFLFGVGIAVLHGRGARLGAAGSAALTAAGVLAAIGFGPAFGVGAATPLWLGQGGPAALIVAGLALGPRWPATPTVLVAGALGDASYSLYLSHPFAVRAMRQAWLRFGHGLPLTLFLVLACAAAILLALGLYRFVEWPVTRSLRRRFDAGRGERHPAGTLPAEPALARGRAGAA